MTTIGRHFRALTAILAAACFCSATAFAATKAANSTGRNQAEPKAPSAQVKKPAAKATASKSKPGSKTTPANSSTKRKPRRNTYTRNGIPTFTDPTVNDVAEFDDATVRAAAVAALGNHNGTVVVVDPNSGRILSIVNQPLAFSEGFQPCSTFKPVVGLAALEQGIITRDTMIKVGRRKYLSLTEALAHSDNPFFESLGRQLGFETVSQYAKQMGLGETAGYNIFEEHPGVFPAAPPEWGGVGKLCSFGEGIQLTPLQLAAIGAAFANGGTLYYLQYPRSEEERQNFAPRVKRQLNISAMLPDVREGLLATVLYGTGHRAYDPAGEQPLGKTGTCSDQGSRLGWFVSYADQQNPKIVVTVLLRGHTRRNVSGSAAAEIAGRVYTRLREQNYFAQMPSPSRQPVMALGESDKQQ